MKDLCFRKWLSVVGCVSLCVLLVQGLPVGARPEVSESIIPGQNYTAKAIPPYNINLSQSRINYGHDQTFDITLSGNHHQQVVSF
jgi:hypothetical protein